MIPHDILSLYSAKMLEYGIAVVFLLLFVPFWQFVQGTATVREPVLARDEGFEPSIDGLEPSVFPTTLIPLN